MAEEVVRPRFPGSGTTVAGRTPGGHQVEFTRTPHGGVLSGALPGGGHASVNVVGPGQVAELDVGGTVGRIWDTLVAVAGALKKVISCSPQQTTTVTTDANGNVVSITVTTTCAPD
ncbi:MAG TPA: hypothetical protein VI408_04255 [Gaiellaceae bacterium]